MYFAIINSILEERLFGKVKNMRYEHIKFIYKNDCYSLNKKYKLTVIQGDLTRCSILTEFKCCFLEVWFLYWQHSCQQLSISQLISGQDVLTIYDEET